MGLFGDKDAAEIPDNPFYVAPDTYMCVLAEVNRVEKNDGTGEGLSFKWVIEDEDSDYNGNNVQEWKNIYPNVTEDEITPDIRKDNSRLKQRLSQIGVPESAMDELLDNLDDLVGIRAYVTVKEVADKKDPSKKYTNIVKVALDD